MIKLLVVDQHPIISKGLELIFNTTQEINFIGSVSDGETLFSFISENRVDLILIEIDLPKLNGITAVRRLKQEYPNIKVIIFSAQPEDVYAVSAIKAGADGYVQKTTDIITLKNAITSVYNDDKVYLSDTLNKRLSINSKGIKNGSYYKKLSTREVEVLKLLASGRRNKEIAEELNINEKTVSTYRARLMKKLNVTNLVDLVNQANSLHL
ncbi:response regulator transcription factor [Lacinutrix neustonica]|uniref:Response regulator transcription factor n=1 Tax=Lacinutrix neustonica TaxID=2980107 RepID=A0A9E8MZ43_9FLAO|nr:response regulator transcription factor [Lacinutrix neustonica]WAC03549.1 response regulator transcription factor [Lacinutrix neustonica]